MPFVKDDPNINKLDTLPEKFTKEFVDYKDVNGKTKGKKFYFSTYGEDRAIILATEYVTQMKKLITEERTRLEQLKESMYGVC